MKLHHLRDVLAVAEGGSLRSASRTLGIAQPAITRSIQELERELGVPLFERKARGVVPTAVGAAFIRRAQAVHRELDRARDEVDQLRGSAHGQVTLALSSVAHLALLPHVLRPFRQRYPRVHLDITEAVFAVIAGRLAGGDLDCYVGPPPKPVPEGLHCEHLFHNTRVVVGRKGHPLSAARSLRELVGADWLTTSVTRRSADEVAPLFRDAGLPEPHIALQVRSALTAIVAIAYSDMLAVLPIQWIESPLLSNALQIIPLEDVIQAPPICIVQRSGLPLTPAAEYFCDLVRRASAGLAPRVPGRRVAPGAAVR